MATEVQDRALRDQERGITRISITIDSKTRRNIRMAAALADLEVGQWATRVLKAAADKAVPADVLKRAKRASS